MTNGPGLEPGAEPIRVASISVTTQVAGSIAHSLRHDPTVTVVAIGAVCVNTAVKACAVARNYLQPQGWDLTVQPHFESAEDGKSAIHLVLQREKINP